MANPSGIRPLFLYLGHSDFQFQRLVSQRVVKIGRKPDIAD
jgi:hypothetical protein